MTCTKSLLTSIFGTTCAACLQLTSTTRKSIEFSVDEKYVEKAGETTAVPVQVFYMSYALIPTYPIVLWAAAHMYRLLCYNLLYTFKHLTSLPKPGHST